MPSRALTLEGETFGASALVGAIELPLNGVGLRSVAWLKGFVAGLYLNPRSKDSAQVLANTGPKRVQMRILIDAPAEELAKAFTKGVGRNAVAAELPGMQERINRFDAQLKALHQLRKGDVLDLDFLPDQGLVMRYNGRLQGQAIPGRDLYTAMLAIFVGPKPVDKALKAGMLGVS